MMRLTWWAVAIALLLAAIFFALATAIEVVACFGHPPRGDRTAAIAAAVALGLITWLLAWLARVTEHHARVGAGFRSGVRASVPPALRSRSRGRQVSATRLHVTEALFSVIWFGFLAGLLAVAVSGYGNWARTSETQSHGASEVATVTAVLAVEHSSRSSSWTTYNFDVTLSHAIRGQVDSVLYTPEVTQFASVGQRVDILVDPEQPTYAELPGEGMGGPAVPIACTVGAAAMIAATAWGIVRMVRMRRLRPRLARSVLAHG